MLQAEVNLEALRGNLRRIRGLVGDTGLLLVVKGDAYGHGLEEVAGAARGLVDWFGVGTLAEARRIRSLGIELPVLILQPPPPRDLPGAVRDGFHLVAGDWELLAEAARAAAAVGVPAFVHLAVDLGAATSGFPPGEVEGVVRELAHRPEVEPVGICSHLPFAHSGRPEEIALTRAQIARFRALLGRLRERGIVFPFVHVANSAGILSFPETLAEPFNLARAGVAAYGYVDGFWRDWGLKPVARLRGEILAVREPSPGTARLALLGAGYRHGLSDRLRWVWVEGARAPIVGRIGLDHTALDVSGVPGARRGSEVIVFDGTGRNLEGWPLPTLVAMLSRAERIRTGAPVRAAG